MAKGVSADLAHERAWNTEPGQTHRHVAGRAARGLDKGRGIRQTGASDSGNKVDQQFAQTDGVSHGGVPLKVEG